jgi:hypothetical protein
LLFGDIDVALRSELLVVAGAARYDAPAATVGALRPVGVRIGPLGYPTGEVADLPDGPGQEQPFEHGVIDRTVTADAVDPTHDRCDFERGSLVLDKTTGTVSEQQQH